MKVLRKGKWINMPKSKTILPSRIYSKKVIKTTKELQMEEDLKNFRKAISELEKSRKHLKKCINKLMSLQILRANDISHILELNDQLSLSIQKLQVNLNKKMGEIWNEVKGK